MKQSRYVAFAVIALALWSCGRNTTKPPPDTNQSPETVLIATPFDTSFIKTPSAGIPTAVIYRYHAHWYGSDPDGRIIGYVVVVTDTNGSPGISDFQNPRNFTTRTDSIFEFRVNANSQRYPHSLWVTALDNNGKADFSPAHVILNAEDRFLPEPFLEESYAVAPSGKIIRLDESIQSRTSAPRDTIPVGSRVHFRWHATTRDPFGRVVGFRVRLGALNIVTRDTSISFFPEQLKNGRNEFHLRGVDAVGGETGAGGGADTSRIFAYNFAPSTWIADPNLGGSPPEMRPGRQQFIEVRDGRVFTHEDGDTILRTSDIRLVFGGWDRDGQVRGFSVAVGQVPVSGVGVQSLPPTPTTPPPGSLGVFEPFVQVPFEFQVGGDPRSGVRTFTVTAFDYDGQKDPRGAAVRVVYGFRPFFKAGSITLRTTTPNATYPAFPDTALIATVSGVPTATDRLVLNAQAFDGNDFNGRRTITGLNSYSIVLDPQSPKATFFEDSDGQLTITLQDGDVTPKALTKGLHVLQVTANDYLEGSQQNLQDGRTSTVLIPFFYISKQP